MLTDKRPIYLNLFRIRLPITGLVSLAHRASGAVLFLSIPLAAYLFDLSVTSAADFDYVLDLLQQPALKLLMLILVWGLAHHLFAGIRFLLIDADIGVEKSGARFGAWLVIAAELVVVVLVIYGSWT